jgi:signal transduction histidine kinase
LLLSIFIYSNTLFVSIQDNNISKKNTYWHTFVGIAIAAAISYFIGLDLNIWILLVFLFSWILLFDLFTDVKQKNITWLIWWAIFLSVYMSAIFFNYDIKKEIKLRNAFLAEAIKPIPKDALIKQYNSVDLKELDSTISKLLDLPEGMKINKADFLDYLSAKSPLTINNIFVSGPSGESIFSGSEEARFPDNLVMVDTNIAFDQIGNKSWFSRKVNDSYQCYIEMSIDTAPSIKKYPFNYYKDGKLLHSDFNIPANVLEDISDNRDDYIFKNSNVYIKWHSDDILLISKKSFESLMKPIAIFSLLFCLIILFGLLLSVSSIWLKYLPDEWPFYIQRADTLNSKIQISLILVILFSFIVIALITNSFLNNFLENEKEKYFLDKIVSISNDIKYQTEVAATPEEMVAISFNFAERIAYIHDVNIKIVPLDSMRQSDNYFNYAYFTKNRNHNAFTEEDDHGDAHSYIPLKFKGKTAAYAAISYNSPVTNPVHVFDFLGSIFNVYVFLFLIASVLAIFMARSITKPLDLLNQKLAKLQLGKRNELIAWDREDEIGNLITNYNTMVHQLADSAQILAKTERDSAWREMAKQVAHEIKNPLTPMKLSIQYLEKAIKQNPAEAVIISKKISATLLEQIDNLAEIANAFGNFAELPQSSNVKVEINEVVEMVHNLFRKREDMDITLSEPIDPIYVYGDKNQLIRILNNLVKNAVESVPISRRGKIKLSLYTQNDNAIIKVSDNGEGIPPDMEDKIFQPKFTTKDSGSGLGLAISANMIESMNGRLYFESKHGEGTDFYIELDIIRPSNYQDQDKRITLD